MAVKGIETKIFGGSIAKKEEFIYWHANHRKAAIEVFDFSDEKLCFGIQATMVETGEKFAIENGFTEDRLEGLNEIVSMIEQKLLDSDEQVKEYLALLGSRNREKQS